jgi:DNA-binding NtrC family response regulator
VSDHEKDLSALIQLFSSWGHSVDIAVNDEEAVRKFEHERLDIAVIDVGMDGFELVRRLRRTATAPLAIVLTAIPIDHLSVDAGGFLVCPKPVDPHHLRALLERSRAQRRLQLDQRSAMAELDGESPEMVKIVNLLRQIAPSSASVLITGESGTGKELVARAIHNLSPRRDGPFVAINCAAFPDGLVESELFGHERGAFTGASERRIGCLELAHGGTLLLDELSDLPVLTQAKLLRVLDDSRVRRIGGRAEIQLDVRILAATNRNPEDAVRKGQFRQDLYYRLNVFHIAIPPLRTRLTDLPALCDALIASLNRKHDRQVTGIDGDVTEQFQQYTWPGNVRELRNVLETAVILTGQGTITTEHLPARFVPGPGVREVSDAVDMPSPAKPGIVALPLGTTVEQAERALIQFTLQHTNQNKSRAAKILGISPKTLHCKIRQYRVQSQAAGAA